MCAVGFNKIKSSKNASWNSYKIYNFRVTYTFLSLSFPLSILTEFGQKSNRIRS